MSTGTRGRLTHFFTVDVEEYFHVSAFTPYLPVARWETLPSRVDAPVDELLAMLAGAGATATFFTLGWLARRRPGLVRRISSAGHEIASHGWWHRKLSTLSRDEVRTELRDSKAVLEDVSGQRVRGFRAPSFSIRPGMEWVFDLLIEEGYDYDSSLFPIHRPDYGYPSAPSQPHVIDRPAGPLREYPLATLALGSVRLPAAGGGYLRHFPYAFTRAAFRQHRRRKQSGVFYVHPWELDPGQPRIATPLMTQLRHRRGLRATAPRIRALLAEFRFRAIAEDLGEPKGARASVPVLAEGGAR